MLDRPTLPALVIDLRVISKHNELRGLPPALRDAGRNRRCRLGGHRPALAREREAGPEGSCLPSVD
jgi:hypothetical protein